MSAEATEKREDSSSARDELIVQYHDYVNCIVGNMIQSMGLPRQLFDEFVSAGYLGLVEAASRFDFKSGRDFKGYAFLRIRGAVIDGIRECADTSGKAYRYVKALQAVHRLREEEPFLEEVPESREDALAEVFDFASKGVLAFRLSVHDVEEEIGSELGEPLTPDEEYCNKLKRESLLDALATLSEKERLVIEEFYFKDRSFTEIAEKHDELSKSWVSRLHSKALAKLQREYFGNPTSKASKIAKESARKDAGTSADTHAKPVNNSGGRLSGTDCT